MRDPGIINGTHFNTSLGAGTYNLNYTYSDGMGCFGQTSGAVFIDPRSNSFFTEYSRGLSKVELQ